MCFQILIAWFTITYLYNSDSSPVLCRTERNPGSPYQIIFLNIFENFGFYIFNTDRENPFDKLEIHFISNGEEKKSEKTRLNYLCGV